jgi:hypothetical protein
MKCWGWSKTPSGTACSFHCPGGVAENTLWLPQRLPHDFGQPSQIGKRLRLFGFQICKRVRGSRA